MTSDKAGRHSCPIPSTTQGSSVMLDGVSGPGHSLDPKFTKEYTTSKSLGVSWKSSHPIAASH